MGNHCICVAALLLALTGGMFLLAKTKKDNLGTFFNVVSWFIIVLSFLVLICCGIRCAAGKACRMKMNCHRNEMMWKEDGDCGRMRGRCQERMMHEEMENGECEEGMMNKMCKHSEENEMGCCMMGNAKKMCVKDSVVIKK